MWRTKEIAQRIFEKIRQNQIILFVILSIYLKSIYAIINVNFIHQWLRIPIGIPLWFLTLSSCIFLGSMLFIARNWRIRAVVVVLFSFAFSLILFADSVYYRGFYDILSSKMLSQAGHVSSFATSIIDIFKAKDFLYFIDIVPLIIYLWKKNTRFTAQVSYKGIGFIAVATFLFFYGTEHLARQFRDGKQYLGLSPSNAEFYSRISPLFWHAYDLYDSFSASDYLDLADNEKSEIENFFASNKSKPAPDSLFGILKGKNVILLQIESLENYIINQSIEGHEITPNLNRIAKSSMRFSNFYEQVRNGISVDADLMVNTSLLPTNQGTSFIRFPWNTYRSLPVILKELGYYSAAFKIDNSSYYKWVSALTSMGYDKCYDIQKFETSGIITHNLNDSVSLGKFPGMIAELPRPFLAFFATMSSHFPFVVNESDVEFHFNNPMYNSPLGNYYQTLHYSDKFIYKFIEDLNKSGLSDSTVLVIYGDHTSIHRFYGDFIRQIISPTDIENDFSRRVPLFIIAPNLPKMEINTICGQTDLLPTLLYLLGIDPNRQDLHFVGHNIFSMNAPGYALYSEGQSVGVFPNGNIDSASDFVYSLSDKIIRSSYFGKSNK